MKTCAARRLNLDAGEDSTSGREWHRALKTKTGRADPAGSRCSPHSRALVTRFLTDLASRLTARRARVTLPPNAFSIFFHPFSSSLTWSRRVSFSLTNACTRLVKASAGLDAATLRVLEPTGRPRFRGAALAVPDEAAAVTPAAGVRRRAVVAPVLRGRVFRVIRLRADGFGAGPAADSAIQLILPGRPVKAAHRINVGSEKCVSAVSTRGRLGTLDDGSD